MNFGCAPQVFNFKDLTKEIPPISTIAINELIVSDNRDVKNQKSSSRNGNLYWGESTISLSYFAIFDNYINTKLSNIFQIDGKCNHKVKINLEKFDRYMISGTGRGVPFIGVFLHAPDVHRIEIELSIEVLNSDNMPIYYKQYETVKEINYNYNTKSKKEIDNFTSDQINSVLDKLGEDIVRDVYLYKNVIKDNFS